jgi:cell division transport system permease protein
VRYGAEWVRRLDDLGVGLRLLALAVGVTVALAIVFIVHNTIRLTVVARRPQVEIMSRLGATDRFIAMPFVIEAVLEAGIAGLLALAVLFGLQQAVSLRILGVTFLPPVWSLAFLAGAMALAWVTAMYALARVLRSGGP